MYTTKSKHKFHSKFCITIKKYNPHSQKNENPSDRSGHDLVMLFNMKQSIYNVLEGKCSMTCKVKRETTYITLVIIVSTNVINIIYTNRSGIQHDSRILKIYIIFPLLIK